MISPRVRLSALAATALCLLTLVPTANAQLAYVGPSTNSGPSADVHDLAFDDKNNVYLHVFYFAGLLRGRFTDLNGNALGQMFNILDRFAGWPSVAYSSTSDVNVFLVTFSTDVNGGAGKNIYGRLLRFNGGNPEFIGGMVPISQFSHDGNVQQESGGIAFNPNTRQFAVSFTAGRDLPGVDNDNFEATVRLINADGSAASADANVSNMVRWQGLTDVAVDWQTNRLMVVWQGDSATGRPVGIWGSIVDGTTGLPVTGPITLSLGGYSDQVKVKYLPEAGNFLAFWHDNQGSPDIVARKISPNGEITSNTYPVVQTPTGDGTPDGAYDWVSRKVFIAGQHDSGYLIGGVLNGVGIPESNFRASQMAPAPNGGTYYPKVVAAANGQFGIGFTLNLNSAWVERWQAPAAAEPGPRPGAGGGGGGGGQPITIDLNGPNGSWFFAEGIANSVFNSYFLIANPHDAPVPVRAFFANEQGVVKKVEFNVPGQSRHTVDLRAATGDGAYGAVIQSMSPGLDIFVERSVYFGTTFGEGSTTAVGTKSGRSSWWFAEGSRGGEYFANYFLLLNPNPTPISVRLDFYRDDGVTVFRDVVIPGQTRYTVNAGTIDELAGKDFSTKVTSVNGEGFISERAMYWGNPWHGGTATVGASAPAQRWLFAEGVGAPFETVYLLLNPNAFPIQVRVDYQPENGVPFFRNYVIEANRRFSVPLNLFEPGIGAVSALFSSDAGFIAERSIYWGTNRFEGSNVVGVNAPANIWYLPEGVDGGSFHTYVLLQNPNDQPTTVDVELFVEGFGRVTFPAHMRPTIAPFGRQTLDMKALLKALEDNGQAPAGSLVGSSFSTRVRVFQGAPIVVEHSIYWDFRDGNLLWRSGGAEFGIPQ